MCIRDSRNDALVVDRRPRLPHRPAGPVRLVDHRQIQRRELLPVDALEGICQNPQRSVGGVDGDRSAPMPHRQPHRVGGGPDLKVPQLRVVLGRAHRDRRPLVPGRVPSLDRLGQQRQCRHQDQDAAFGRDPLRRGCGDDGLPRSARGVHLTAKAVRGNAARRNIKAAYDGGDGFDLMLTQFHGHGP